VAIPAEILAAVTLDDLQGDLRMIAEACGIEVALELHAKCSSLKLYIPANALDEFKRRFIRENRKKHSPKHLAQMLAVSETYVYNILSEEKIKASQTSLF